MKRYNNTLSLSTNVCSKTNKSNNSCTPRKTKTNKKIFKLRPFNIL